MDDKEDRRPIVSHGQVRKRRKDGWTRRDERIFFKHLRATSNVAASARAAGKSPSSAHDLRARDPAFAEQWLAELRDAEIRIHGKLIVFIETRGKEAEPREDGEPVEPDMADFDPDLALKLLKYNRESRSGGRRGNQHELRIASKTELIASIRRLVAMVRKRRAKGIA